MLELETLRSLYHNLEGLVRAVEFHGWIDLTAARISGTWYHIQNPKPLTLQSARSRILKSSANQTLGVISLRVLQLKSPTAAKSRVVTLSISSIHIL
jgi:hypothetical protein